MTDDNSIAVPDAIVFVVKEIAKVLPKFMAENKQVLIAAGMVDGLELKRAMAAIEISAYEAALPPALKAMREMIGSHDAPPLRDVVAEVFAGATRH